MKPNSRLAARIAASLLGLRHEFQDWWIHRSDSGRWLAIRGNTCIRAKDPTGLRGRLRQHIAEIADDLVDASANEIPGAAPLADRLGEQLAAEFPGWLITREPSGRWAASLPRWGRLYGQSAAELRERLRQHTKGTTHEDA